MNSYPCSNILWVKTTVFSVLQNNCSRGHTTLKSCSWSNVRTRLAQICHLFGNSTSSHIAGLQLPYLGSSPCVDVWCGVPVPAETADITRLKLNRCVSSAVFLLKMFSYLFRIGIKLPLRMWIRIYSSIKKSNMKEIYVYKVLWRDLTKVIFRMHSGDVFIDKTAP